MNETPFHCFRSFALDENAEGMAAMLDAGFDVNAVNAAHQTMVMHCCANDRPRAARLLLARGADVNVSDHGGTTAMDFALRHASRDRTRRRPARNEGVIVQTRWLVILLALTLAACAQSPQPQPAATPDAGGEAINGSENQSDASRPRTRT